MGYPLMYYALNSGNFDQLVTFLMLPKWHGNINFNKPLQYMVMQNALYFSLRGESLIDRQISINIDDIEVDQNFFGRLIYLFEEIGIIKEIVNDTQIDKFLSLVVDVESNKKNMYEIDILLGFMISYWCPGGEIYERNKKILTRVSPFYELIFLIIENRCEDFIHNFPAKIRHVEDMYEIRYMIDEVQNNIDDQLYETYTSNLLFVLFFTAIKTEQSKIIDCICKNDAFVTIKFEFPHNIQVKSIHYYAALTLLNGKHELGGSNIPNEWLTHEVFEEFLNSRIRYCDEELIELDFTFMIHAESQKIKIKSRSDLEPKYLMLEDTKSLEYIESNESMKRFIVHPIIETYINLKSFKYNRIFLFNFWSFVIFYIFPILALITKNHMKINDEGITLVENVLGLISSFHYFGIGLLIIRELFQFFTSKTAKQYFKQFSNLLEITLIALSIFLSFWINHTNKNKSGLVYLEASLILVITVNATSALPSAYAPLNMEILKRVSMTFLGLFYTFAIIIIAYTISFFLIFKPEMTEITDENSMKQNNSCCNEKDAIDNFESLDYSFVKILLMLSGEYSIEPVSLQSFYQLIFFTIFVISSFILYNLILGLSIENVQEIKLNSRLLVLRKKLNKLIYVGNKLVHYNR